MEMIKIFLPLLEGFISLISADAVQADVDQGTEGEDAVFVFFLVLFCLLISRSVTGTQKDDA